MRKVKIVRAVRITIDFAAARMTRIKRFPVLEANRVLGLDPTAHRCMVLQFPNYRVLQNGKGSGRGSEAASFVIAASRHHRRGYHHSHACRLPHRRLQHRIVASRKDSFELGGAIWITETRMFDHEKIVSWIA